MAEEEVRGSRTVCNGMAHLKDMPKEKRETTQSRLQDFPPISFLMQNTGIGHASFPFSLISISFQISKDASATLDAGSDIKSTVLNMIQVLAYMFTRSKHVPGMRAPTLFAANPRLSKTGTYHGLKPADLKKTRPCSLSARLRALICRPASGPVGLNQSIESMITAMVNVLGERREMTSLISSVWIRSPSNAPGFDNFLCAFALR